MPALLVLMLAAGCADDEAGRPVPIDARAQLGLGDSAASFAPAPDWWRSFGDPGLDDLMARALRQSPTLELAEGRLREARESLHLSQSGDWPNLGLDAGADRERVSASSIYPPPLAGAVLDNEGASLAFGYDLDLWGRRRSLIAGAAHSLEASDADLSAARLYLTAAIAQAYFAVRADLLRVGLAQDLARVRTELLGVNRARLAAGREPVSPGLESRAALEAARLSVVQARQQLALDRDQLAALAGLSAETLPEIAPQPLPALDLPVEHLTLDLLARRPDVVSARLQVAAAADRRDVARADFFPDISLSAMIGQSTIHPADFLKASSRVWSVGPALHLPIFDGGQLRANLGIARAQLDQAVAAYNQSVVGAIQDGADALALYEGSRGQLAAGREGLAQARRQSEVQAARMKAGLGDAQTARAAEAARLAQELAVVDLDGRSLAATVLLEKALGGGYRHEMGTP